MPAGTTGMEVEIRPVDSRISASHHDHEHRPHVAVVDRPAAGGTVPSLVFPELSEGGYELYEKGTHRTQLSVEIRGGEVTSTDWPTH